MADSWPPTIRRMTDDDYHYNELGVDDGTWVVLLSCGGGGQALKQEF